MELEKLSSVAEYARMKNVSTTAVYKWIKANKVKVVVISDITFIVRED